MQKQKTLPRSAKKHIRQEKARIRHEFSNPDQKDVEIEKAYNRLSYYLGKTEVKVKKPKDDKKKKPKKEKTKSAK